MKFEITEVGQLSIIGISFDDEGVELTEHTTVVGDKQAALKYLPFFEKDCRQNYAHLFPQPEPAQGSVDYEGGTI